jgi:small subunit ribosomal protein S7
VLDNFILDNFQLNPMPRKSRSYDKHTPAPDPKFGSVKYAKFINYLMQRGKKNVARQILYDALEIVTEKMQSVAPAPQPAPKAGEEGKAKPVKMDGRSVFDQALKNVAPIMEIKGRRIGGSNYQVPMEVQEPRRTALGMKWLIAAAQSKKGQRMAEKLATEIMDAYNKTGAAIKKREDVHRMAEANKAFAHFARFGRR